MLTFMLTCVTCASNVTSLGWGVGMLTFMLTCATWTSNVRSLGWGVGMLTFMLTCVTCTSNGHVNPKLMRSIRVWQWRWINSTTKGLMEVTGQALKNRMAMWVEKNRASFQAQIPCKLQVIVKKPLQNPGDFEDHFGEWISSFAMAKTTFFQNAQNAGAVFPPPGCLCLLLADNHSAIRRALLRKSQPRPGNYDIGQLVLYWKTRNTTGRREIGRWHGPARVFVRVVPPQSGLHTAIDCCDVPLRVCVLGQRENGRMHPSL